ncbi:phosphomevalonate kinase-like [Saccostrea echinata]|uniref:phosphomevalonate kinase-like n=1 Tax=Saccostrea echinata TaxID=191078 RepID=UPI002A7F513E|nr:phosphomevalonate kinase-like [Saccostrea echinata]
MVISPRAIVVFSGKRKSGKDFIADLLQEKFSTELCTVLRLSGPIKSQYAKENGLDHQRLLDSSEYKETYREDMIQWGEEKRNENSEYFCVLATSGTDSDKEIWVISDARRKTDIEYFLKYYPQKTITVRIEATIAVRKARGFVFKKGVDDAESECGLDSYSAWDHIINNNGDSVQLEQELNPLINDIKKLQQLQLS